MGNILGIIVLLLSLVVLGGTTRLSMPYFQNEFPQILFSFIGSFATLLVSILFLFRKNTSKKWICTKWGLLVGAGIFVFLQTLIISTHDREILTDGTAYWIFLMLPSIYILLPIFIAGTLIGVIIDAVKNKKSNQRVDSTESGS